MKNLLVGLFAIIFINLAIQAQGNSTANQIVRDSEKGFSFSVPSKWTKQTADGSYVLLNSAKTASIVVKPHNYNDFESFVRAEINLERDGFTQAGEVRDLGNGGRMFRIFKPNGNKNVIVDTFFMLSAYQGGILIVSLSADEEVANNAYQAASQVANSMQFSRPVQSQQSSNYQTAFAGKKLSFYHTANGYSERRVIYLCPSGSYFSTSESSSLSGLGSAATSSSDQGTWKVQSSGNSVNLLLTSGRGNGQRNFSVTARQAGNEIGLNGNRYFVQTHNECN